MTTSEVFLTFILRFVNTTNTQQLYAERSNISRKIFTFDLNSHKLEETLCRYVIKLVIHRNTEGQMNCGSPRSFHIYNQDSVFVFRLQLEGLKINHFIISARAGPRVSVKLVYIWLSSAIITRSCTYIYMLRRATPNVFDLLKSHLAYGMLQTSVFQQLIDATPYVPTT